MSLNRKTLAILTAILAVFIACPAATVGVAYLALQNPSIHGMVEGVTDLFGDMLTLQREIAAEYHVEAVEVKVQNGTVLIVSMINSTTDDADEGRQAEDIARFVTDHYADIDAISNIQVAFVRQAQALGVNVNTTHTYVFDVADLD